jgi:gamma-glutamyltranspeptidase
MPGVLLAEQGFEVSESLARSINRELAGPMKPFPASIAAYGKPGGGEWQAGDRIVLADLGKTLRAIATDGPDVFYTGWIADLIAADMKANGGLITKEDLAQYEAKERAPVRGTYKGFEIISMPPVSSGGVALVQMLNILEPLRSEVEGAADRARAAPADRSDAPRLPRSRAVSRRSGLRRRPRREAHVEGAREGRRRHDRPDARLAQRRTRQGHRHRRPR